VQATCGGWAMRVWNRDVCPVGMAIGFSLCLGAALLAQDAKKDDTAAAVVGNKSTKTFHRPDCAVVRRVATKSKVDFADPGAAKAAGYKPCPVCKPDPDAPDPKVGSKTKAGKKGETTTSGAD